ncbi:hypothetical protein BGZ99_000201 [Dissophora globulifera]|uniref:RING-type domain-containing protein n=1 Tax=Dissophora globulifera TaxID=979702 RepID=A0A9P6RQ01_9FUNG|nr:hypothetical protein BGZ99_000201 [Dissophora globulifera]
METSPGTVHVHPLTCQPFILVRPVTQIPQLAGVSSSSSSSQPIIDLTERPAPRTIHPNTLPSQSVEIIEINSDDDTPHHNHSRHQYHNTEGDENDNNNNWEDEVQFLRATPAPLNRSHPSRDASQAPLGSEIFLHRHLYTPESFRQEREQLRRAPTMEEQRRQLIRDSIWGPSARSNTLGSGLRASTRRPLHDRMQVSDFWGPVRPEGGGGFRYRGSLSNAEYRTLVREPVHNFLETVLGLQFLHQHQHQHQQQQHHQHHHRHQPRFGDDVADYAPFFTDDEDGWGEEPLGGGAFDDLLDENMEDVESEPKPVVPARPGYTKSLNAEVTIACPVCCLELGHKGKENTKLWVVVGCGHVICDDCVEGIFMSKVAVKGSKARRSSISKRSKGKGKAKWTASGAQSDEQDGQIDTNTSPLQDADAAGVKTSPDVTFKVVKRVTGACPSCNRKIKKTSIQQLYL